MENQRMVPRRYIGPWQVADPIGDAVEIELERRAAVLAAQHEREWQEGLKARLARRSEPRLPPLVLWVARFVCLNSMLIGAASLACSLYCRFAFRSPAAWWGVVFGGIACLSAWKTWERGCWRSERGHDTGPGTPLYAAVFAAFIACAAIGQRPRPPTAKPVSPASMDMSALSVPSNWKAQAAEADRLLKNARRDDIWTQAQARCLEEAGWR